MGSLDSWSVEFEKIGWFIPPYVSMSQMDKILSKNVKNQSYITQAELEIILADLYSPLNMANLYVEKYSKTPFIKDYIEVLGDGLEAHFLGLHYAAVATLIPVVEGISRRLAKKRNVEHRYIKQTIKNLCESCKTEVNSRKLGAYEEVESMIDSFKEFSTKKLYIDSSQYPHSDYTNRNGITHAAYDDSDYGTPINFYKTVAAINSLCFLSEIDSSLSWFPPKESESGSKMSLFFSKCQEQSNIRERSF
ncbi:hypothetical protein [Litoribrevibacter albus]|uniref:Uncharacterized protein n=1 Tax=Litoribrevibacter albus TaxID=1473156 RepID=A0AA37SDW9_9GAMM|nr:hypothetical protein [Litoribrevibacter albus]GLQ32748.1 hypothetical protein GCM10007876_32270 [Litoribrevibacter albus]